MNKLPISKASEDILMCLFNKGQRREEKSEQRDMRDMQALMISVLANMKRYNAVLISKWYEEKDRMIEN